MPYVTKLLQNFWHWKNKISQNFLPILEKPNISQLLTNLEKPKIFQNFWLILEKQKYCKTFDPSL